MSGLSETQIQGRKPGRKIGASDLDQLMPVFGLRAQRSTGPDRRYAIGVAGPWSVVAEVAEAPPDPETRGTVYRVDLFLSRSDVEGPIGPVHRVHTADALASRTGRILSSLFLLVDDEDQLRCRRDDEPCGWLLGGATDRGRPAFRCSESDAVVASDHKPLTEYH